MHVNDEEVSCQYEGRKAEARVALLHPTKHKGWRVTVWQAIWGEGFGARYSSIDHHHTYHCRDRISALKRFETLSAAMVAVFCTEGR